MDMLKGRIKYIILILAITSFAFGIYSGEMKIVLAKAIRICLECCGIG